MKKLSLLVVLMVMCSIPGYSQFWINFAWNEPHCRSCAWMEQALHLTPRQANDYHKIIHKYGERIERETRRDYRQWDKAAKKIYNLRVDRDQKIQRILNPQQFDWYVRYVQESPKRIHDYRGWYENPRYAGHRYSPDWRRYEDNYFAFHWYKAPARPRVSQDRYDDRYDKRNDNRRKRESNSRREYREESDRRGRR